MNTTPIGDLPELDDVMDRNDIPKIKAHPFLDPIDPRYQKFIKPEHKMSPYSGMIQERHGPSNHQGGSHHQSSHHDPFADDHHRFKEQTRYDDIYVNNAYNNQQYNPSCIDFANHYQSCPICSRFYKTDKIVMYTIIITLCLVCLILLKKVIHKT